MTALRPRHLAPVAARMLQVGGEALGGLRTLAASRTVRPVRPDRLVRVMRAQRRYGSGIGFLLAAAAELHPARAAVIDERGAVSFGELDREAAALAGALHHRLGVRAGARVAIMARNHRGFVQAAAAASRLGCDLVPLNTDFAAPQLADVLTRERVEVVIHDEEFVAVMRSSGFTGIRILAWTEYAVQPAQDGEPDAATLAELIAGDPPPAPSGALPGRTIMLTSGTTGTPKGATRTIRARALAPMALAGLLDLSRVRPTPRSGEPLVVAPPLFHLFGQIGLLAGFALGSPIVIRRRFDPEAVLAGIERERAGVLLAVPTMLGRILDLPPETRERYDTSSLRLIASGAAPLRPQLAAAAIDRFGAVLYNGYASTEVGAVTLATPGDLRAAPGTVGRPMAGVSVRILSEHGDDLPDGATGRIFVSSPLLFDGYSGGGGKEVIDGRMSTGDIGHFDAAGRLFIDGRDDEMVLSGGENVFPQEIEDLLTAHPAVADAAVFGVPDPDFGQRLSAQVVMNPDASVSADELRAHIRDRLARFKVPREIEFVSQLPRTASGKLKRTLLSGDAS